MNGNPLFNMFGGNMGSMMPPPLNNMSNLIGQFNQFRNNFQGSPDQARQQVQQMLNNGQINQNQFNQMANMANQIMNMIGRR